MDSSYFEVSGNLVEPGELEGVKARDLALRLSGRGIDFVKLVECRREGEIEVVVFDVDVEVAQIQKHPVRPTERISASFPKSDKEVPIIHALRKDFPLVPHLNLHRQEFPRNLCLYQEPYEDLKRDWTSPKFVRDIAEWLALTSKGELHQEDQPLEPLLVDYFGHIVLPPPSQLQVTDPVPLSINQVRSVEGKKPFFVAKIGSWEKDSTPILASVHVCQPQIHGVIHRIPTTLADLLTTTTSEEFDLLCDLRARLRNWHTSNYCVLDNQLLLIILFPKMRKNEGQIEVVDMWAFLLWDLEDGNSGDPLQIRKLGTKIGLWDLNEKQVGLLLKPDTSKRGDTVGIGVLNIAHDVDRFFAATLNNEESEAGINLVAIGIGALGSQVIMNLARSGFGTCTLVDHDFLMPHNVVRHALDGNYVGWNKATAVASVANTIVNDSNLFTALPVNVLSPGNKTEYLSKTFAEADAILDMSASVSVARMLARDTVSPARRISLFLTPSGQDLVLLGEDKKRDLTLDALEMQYYRAVMNDRRLSGHLYHVDRQYRYAQSCRDVTSRLPQHTVALHASNGKRELKDVLRRTDAAVAIWRSREDGSVRRVNVNPSPLVRKQINSWTIITDNGLLAKLSSLRQSKLPNETGGVLLGSFDMERRIVYIVDALPSPPDSEEWPTLYIRGCEGLSEKVVALSRKTLGMVVYIGEWHSHPPDAGRFPSKDDSKVFEWLQDLMEEDGYPPLLMVVEEPGTTGYYVDKIGTIP